MKAIKAAVVECPVCEASGCDFCEGTGGIKVLSVKTLILEINRRESELDPKDAEGHVWWNKFRQMIIESL